MEASEMPDWKKKTEAAHDAVSRLCLGEDWQMHIPVNPQKDHDIIISDALRAATARIAELEGVRDVAEKQRDEYKEAVEVFATSLAFAEAAQ